MSGGHFPEDGQEVAEAAISTKVAVMIVSGKSINAISKELKITAHTVKKILNSDSCIAAIRSIERDCLTTAKAHIRTGVGQLAQEVVRVLKKHLEDDNLNAIAPALKILGFSEQEQVQTDTSITVILPDSSNKPINVTQSKTRSDRQEQIEHENRALEQLNDLSDMKKRVNEVQD